MPLIPCSQDQGVVMGWSSEIKLPSAGMDKLHRSGSRCWQSFYLYTYEVLAHIWVVLFQGDRGLASKHLLDSSVHIRSDIIADPVQRHRSNHDRPAKPAHPYKSKPDPIRRRQDIGPLKSLGTHTWHDEARFTLPTE
jgi:hypothetical protein